MEIGLANVGSMKYQLKLTSAKFGLNALKKRIQKAFFIRRKSSSRKDLKEILTKESLLVREESCAVLKEFESLGL